MPFMKPVGDLLEFFLPDDPALLASGAQTEAGVSRHSCSDIRVSTSEAAEAEIRRPVGQLVRVGVDFCRLDDAGPAVLWTRFDLGHRLSDSFVVYPALSGSWTECHIRLAAFARLWKPLRPAYDLT